MAHKNPKEIIARRVAQEIKPGMIVNLGIGLPSLVAGYVAQETNIVFHAESGLIGLGTRPPEGMEAKELTDAGGGFVSAVPGAAAISSETSFALIRGGHLDLTILGGLQVDERGYLANWSIPAKLIPGMGGAMDLVTGARMVIVAMTHSANGTSKLVRRCCFPLTAERRVDLIVTELGVFRPVDGGLHLLERGCGVSVQKVQDETEANIIHDRYVPEMDITTQGGCR